MNKTVIRVGKIDDAKKLLQIYAPYVLHTAISFEYEVPSVEEFKERMRHVLSKYPYLVAEREGEVVGYAYAGPFKTRAAYEWAVETTIYVKEDKKKMGIGRELYQALEQALKLQNILTMNACIGYPKVEDEYLSKNSAQFHSHLGYRLVGEFYQCGYKFRRWYNMVWMEKQLGVHKEIPLAVKKFDEIRGEWEEQYGIK